MCARRTLNPYGYLFSAKGKKVPWPGAQLKTLLNLQNNDEAFQVIKENILRLMEKHMDLNSLGAGQVDNLRAIENELKKQNPEIFAAEESEKRLYFATRLALHQHSDRRYRWKKQIEKHPANLSAAITTRNSKKIELRARSESDHDNHGMPESASQILPRSNDKSSMGIKPNPDVTYKKHDSNQYHDIHSFLETSMPPMTHLMDAFIDFGCINADFLLAISSWSFEKIRGGILDRLSLGPNGRQLTEMEKFTLQYHFKEYSTRLGKRGNSLHKSDL